MEGVFETGAYMIILRCIKHLSFVSQSTKRPRMKNTVDVSLVEGAIRVRSNFVFPTCTFSALLGVFR